VSYKDTVLKDIIQKFLVSYGTVSYTYFGSIAGSVRPDVTVVRMNVREMPQTPMYRVRCLLCPLSIVDHSVSH